MIFCTGCGAPAEDFYLYGPCPRCAGGGRLIIPGPPPGRIGGSWSIRGLGPGQWVHQWFRVRLAFRLLRDGYAQIGLAHGNLELDLRVTTFFTERTHLYDWLLNDKVTRPKTITDEKLALVFKPPRLDPRSSEPLHLCHAVANSHKHQVRFKPEHLTAAILDTVGTSDGNRVELRFDWQAEGAWSEDALDLAARCVESCRMCQAPRSMNTKATRFMTTSS
jgi:hypothetical protein